MKKTTSTLKNQELKIEELKRRVGKLTPMMEQFHDIKIKHRDLILFFRMGDFYEVFFEDAELTSKVLNIALTKRGKIAGEPVPMAGIPHHSAANYIDRVTQAGYRVAICEQTEDPKLAKGIVKRAVTQIVSPSLPYDLEKSKNAIHHFLGSFHYENDEFYLSLVDFTTGDFIGLKAKDQKDLADKIKLYNPKEFLLYFDQLEDFPELRNFFEHEEILSTYISLDFYQEKNVKHYLKKILPFYDKDQTLMTEPYFLPALSALSYYIISTQTEDSINHIKQFKYLNESGKMKISFQTLNSLEIFTNKSSQKLSLVQFIDKTISSLGRRKLNSLCKNPLMDQKEIENRHELIEYFLSKPDDLKTLRNSLKNLRDLERIFAKLSTNKLQGFDLLNLANAIEIYSETLSLFPQISKHLKTDSLKETSLKKFSKKIRSAINDEVGATLSKGNLILEGYDKSRDELKNIEISVGKKIEKLQEKYRKKFGINTLRIKSNNINGYYVEVPKAKAELIGEELTRRQTLVNSQRFSSPELNKIQEKVFNAEIELLKKDREIFDSFSKTLHKQLSSFIDLSDFLGFVDAFQGLSWLVIQEGFSRPKFHKKKEIKIKELWHPLVKKVLQADFISHHVHLDPENFFALITGPNMAGKTTVMREVAITQYLAQIGSFVPAISADLPICDYIFSRIGASDDIAQGQSTFMLEMSETSEILRHASDKSLVILDEIGRGTSTYDGLSIAWALVEYFVKEVKALTMFSTHYHELIDVVNDLKGAKNFTVKTSNIKGKVQFLYELIEGGATQSFGIHVAKLAGLPKEVLSRSTYLLKKLESEDNKIPTDQLDLFSAPIAEDEVDPIIDEIKDLNINSMTPIDALNTLNNIHQRIQ